MSAAQESSGRENDGPSPVVGNMPSPAELNRQARVAPGPVPGSERSAAALLAGERARVSTQIHVHEQSEIHQRGIEQAESTRVPAHENDSGQVEVLADGSVSIPVLEEQLVVEKRLVVRERVIVSKRTVYEPHEITAQLRREEVSVETGNPGSSRL